MSTQTRTTEENRELILTTLNSKVENADKIASLARDAVKVNKDSRYEAQARTFMEGVARQAVGDEIWEIYKRVRDAVDPVQELEKWVEEFTEMVLRHGQRTPSDVAGRAFDQIKHLYMIDATKDLKSILKAAKRREQ